jgi:hypothetical protein
MLSDRDFLKKLSKYLRINNKIVQDECSDYCIYGKKAKIYTDSIYWYVYYTGGKWNTLKKTLSFMEVWQDGDSEGVLRKELFPSSEEATVLRKTLGLGKKRILTEKQKEGMKKHMFKPRGQLCIFDH